MARLVGLDIGTTYTRIWTQDGGVVLRCPSAAAIDGQTRKLVALGAEARKICKNACIGCKKCEKSCPHGAISVVDNCAVIDYTKCTNCGVCVSECPTGCLKTVVFPDLPKGVGCDEILG